MIYTLKAGFLNSYDIKVDKKQGTLETNNKTFSRDEMKEIIKDYRGANRIHKPIAVLFYTDVMNGENVKDNYGSENVIIGESNIKEILKNILAEEYADENSDDTMKYTKKNKNYLNREDETNVIAYQIQNSDDIILDKMPNGDFIVKTSDGVMIYSKSEMEEIYVIDINASDFERLGWTV